MAFNRNAQGNNNDRGNDRDANWKADGFINLYLPNAKGTKSKLGAVPLRLSNANEKMLFDYLKAQGEAGTDTLKTQLIIEFRTAEPDAGAAFKLG